MTNKTLGSWIVFRKSKPNARFRLFCFPYAGGGASIYRSWSEDLPEIEVCPVQLPGRESRLREKPFTHISNLVEAAAEALLPHLNMPFALFGHSMGALISFELIRHLRRLKGPSPVHFFVSAHRAPQIPDLDPPIHQLPDAELMENLRELNGTPEAVLQNAELMQMLLPLLRADFGVCETYAYADEEKLDCPISVFGGLEDREVTSEDLNKWRDQTHGAFKQRMLPGNHFFLQDAKKTLLQALYRDLIQPS